MVKKAGIRTLRKLGCKVDGGNYIYRALHRERQEMALSIQEVVVVAAVVDLLTLQVVTVDQVLLLFHMFIRSVHYILPNLQK
jgi:hypothetical protein